MPKFPKPWFRPDRGVWYVTLNGKQHNLGPDRDQAFERYHSLMRQPSAVKVPQADVVAVLVDAFLDYVAKNRSRDTYLWYQSRLQRFVERYPSLRLDELKGFHLQSWIDSFPGAASTTKRNYCRSIMTCLRWCEAQGLIDRSPLAHFKKPRAGVREITISPEEYAAIQNAIRNEAFRDLVSFAWESGARAAECLALERKHIDFESKRIVFPPEEEKMQLIPRIIYLNESALKILQPLATRFPSGAVFRNSTGRPWSTEAVNCAFVLLRIRMGWLSMQAKGLDVDESEVTKLASRLAPTRRVHRKQVVKSDAERREEARRKLRYRMAAKHAKKYCLTAFRHSWCHRALKSGVDALTVSVLMGHADTSMIARVYSHLSHAPEYLLKSLEMVAE